MTSLAVRSSCVVAKTPRGTGRATRRRKRKFFLFFFIKYGDRGRIEIDHLYALCCCGWYCYPAQHSLCGPSHNKRWTGYCRTHRLLYNRDTYVKITVVLFNKNWISCWRFKCIKLRLGHTAAVAPFGANQIKRICHIMFLASCYLLELSNYQSWCVYEV